MPENEIRGKRNIQRAAVRPTEGQRVGSVTSGSQRQRGASAVPGTKRGAGRPKGSLNKSKGILPTELASAILLQMQDMLPKEHFEYMKGVIKDGKAISTKHELDTLILLLSRNLYPALVLEQVADIKDDPDDDESYVDPEIIEEQEATQSQIPPQNRQKIRMPVFRKDVTERLKVLNSLLSLRNQVEKRDTDPADGAKPIIQVFARSGIDPERIRILVGVESGTVAGNSNGVGDPALPVGAVPDQISSGQELLPPSEQGSPDRVLDSYSSGGSPRGGDETELPS